MRPVTKAATFLVAATVGFATTANAQTTQCQWIGSVWTCNEQASSKIDWSIGLPRQNTTDAFKQGMEIGDRARRAESERERIEAETELYRAQTRAVTGQATPGVQPSRPPSPDYLKRWAAAAQPRMGLFPDFEKVVFSPEVSISNEMVMLMSGSTFAADIAYHLATHKAEAMAISQLPLLDAARAIDSIEAKLKAQTTAVATPAEP